MSQSKTSEARIAIKPPNPKPRILVIQSDSKLWIGCVYISSYDLTGNFNLYLMNTKKVPPEFRRKIPYYIFYSSTKDRLEAKILQTIKDILLVKDLI